MSNVYKRIINEHLKLNHDMEKNSDIFLYKSFVYKITTIENDDILFKSEIEIKYKNKTHKILILYDKNYPFSCPNKILLNDKNILDIYKKIMTENKDLFLKCICCNSLLCDDKWTIKKTLINIFNEIIKIIDYDELYIKRQLLNKITNKFTNQHLDYLHYYLL
jgi:ubiquitin-protein ligase